MNLQRMALAAVLVNAVVVATTGVAQAEPATHGVDFRAQRVDNAVVLTVGHGSFDLPHKPTESIAIKDDSGQVVETLPTTFTFNGMRYPVKQDVSTDKRTLKLTPIVDRKEAKPVAAEALPPKIIKSTLALPTVDKTKPRLQLKPIASDQENALAQMNFMNQLGIATTVGSIVGTVIGAIVGGVAGAAVALASCIAFFACFIIGLPIFIAFATAGGIGGTVLAGGGALVSAGWDYVQTLQAAPGTTHYQVQIDKQNAQPHR